MTAAVEQGLTPGRRQLRRGAGPALLPRFFLSLALLVGLPTTALAAEQAPSAPAMSLNRQVLMDRADKAFQAKRYAEAADLYRRAAALDPQSGDAALMAGVAAFQLDEYRQARRDVSRALRRQLSEEDREIGQLYLELIDEETSGAEEAEAPFTPSISTRFGGGFDSNPQQAGASDLDAAAAGVQRRGAAFGLAALELGVDGSPLPGLELGLAYTLEQTAYGDRALADLDYQDHLLELTLGRAIGESATVEGTLSGDLSFTGAGTRLRLFSRSARLDLDVTLGSGPLQLRLGGAAQAMEVVDEDLSFLSGRRLEIRATPVLERWGWRGSLTARLRSDTVGEAHSAPDWDEAQPLCDDCTVSTRVPYSSRSAALSARVGGPLRWRVRPGFSARIDRRLYHQRAELERASSAGSSRTTLGDRLSGTFALGANARLRLTPQIALTARWDYMLFGGIFRADSPEVCAGHGECGAGPLADRLYSNQTVSLELSVDFL